MTVIEDLKVILFKEIPEIDEVIVERVCLGLGYTGVKLHGGQFGVCHTLLSEMVPDCCRILDSAGTFAGRPVIEFLGMASSWNLGERVIGIATLNALSQIVFESHPDRFTVEKGNLVDVIEVGPDDIVALVGLIKPFVPVFRKNAKELFVLERGSGREMEVLPDTACEEVVPKADVVVITGSSLANGTVDRLLELASGARVTALVGPTVSCVPDPLFKRGADYVGGIRIRDADKALQILIEGGGTPRLRLAGEFVTFKVK
ncbi:MAG: DUF364 domain-containing protein [Candidatus Bathyarchaeota archaeon]|jgi:uncharacterized protein (DUF4213/DUF364 family)